MDTSVEACMNVHRKDGSIMMFTEYSNRLYKFDAALKQPINTSNDAVTFYSPDFVFLETVEKNRLSYTRHEIEGASKARQLYRKLVYPSQKRFEYWSRNNLIHNCPVTCHDAQRAVAIHDGQPQRSGVRSIHKNLSDFTHK